MTNYKWSVLVICRSLLTTENRVVSTVYMVYAANCLWCICAGYCPWTRIRGKSRLNGFEWTTQRARARRIDPLFTSSCIGHSDPRYRTTCPLGTPPIFTGNNQGNLGDVSSVLLRSVCVVCIYIYMYICTYAIVTAFVGIIMLWTVSTIGNMFVWPCGSFGIVCYDIHGKTFVKNETICEFFSCMNLPCQRE
jgi:hypothetical protein